MTHWSCNIYSNIISQKYKYVNITANYAPRNCNISTSTNLLGPTDMCVRYKYFYVAKHIISANRFTKWPHAIDSYWW